MSGARLKKTAPGGAPESVSLILETRRRRQWTQKQLAWELGVHINTVKRWESGKRTIHPVWLKLIASL